MTQTQILDYMRSQSRPMTVNEISDATGYNVIAVRKALRRLSTWNLVRNVGLIEGLGGNSRKLWEAVA